MAQKALRAPCVYCCRAFILSRPYVLHGSYQKTTSKWAVLVYIKPVFPFSCVQCEKSGSTNRAKYGCGGRACALKLPAQQFVCPLSFLRPLRFARVILKKHPKNDRFGLHKSAFPFSCVQGERARAIFGDYKRSVATANPLQAVSLPCARGGGLGALAAKPEGLFEQRFLHSLRSVEMTKFSICHPERSRGISCHLFFQQPSRRGCAAPPSLTQGGHTKTRYELYASPVQGEVGWERKFPSRRGCCR